MPYKEGMYLVDRRYILGMRVESQVRVRYELEGEVDKRLKKLQPCDWSGEGVACTDETCPDLFGPVGCDGFHKPA